MNKFINIELHEYINIAEIKIGNICSGRISGKKHFSRTPLPC